MSIAYDMRRCGYNDWAQEVERLEAELEVIREKSTAVVQHWAAAEQGEMASMMDKSVPPLRDSLAVSTSRAGK